MATTILDKCKTALRLSTDYYDDEIWGLIASAKKDLAVAGVQCKTDPDGGVVIDALIDTAIVTYVRVMFGDLEDGQRDRLKASYDEQKAQLVTATGYTDWGTV